ncbi:MAG TPA: sigma-54 dependent transcriptional regulator [Polyangiaceae bacterium]|jgi:DNA-binding NtrC family response regulator|nr:sigma-54 dependent transcriptional regulator [Polyangiaceae bacterium]
MEAHILVIDDEPDVCELLKLTLERQGATVVAYTSAQQGLEHIENEEFDCVLTDLGMPGMSGIELCERIGGARPGLPVIVVTGEGRLDTAIAAMRAGAYDFLTKPIEPKLIALSVGRAVQHHRLRVELKRLRDAVDLTQTPSGMVGSSASMKRVQEMIGRIATGEASVLVNGETGTGKELVARRIHAMSPRREGRFVAINCAAVPHSLFESELFGHAKGAFTDAKSERTGLFLQANKGTLFLDEIGEMPLDVQAKLLRALQERKVRPVGANSEIPFDTRIVAATNRDLEEEVEEKRFREDLFYRINVVRIHVPPLRERASDVLELAHYFLRRHAERTGKAALAISAEAAHKLVAYRWPGNVRELENCIDRAVAFARFDQVVVDDLPEKIGAYRADHFVVSANEADEVVPLAEIERRYVHRVITLLGGNKSRAAEVLGIDRRTLHRKLGRWDEAATGEGSQESRGQ